MTTPSKKPFPEKPFGTFLTSSSVTTPDVERWSATLGHPTKVVREAMRAATRAWLNLGATKPFAAAKAADDAFTSAMTRYRREQRDKAFAKGIPFRDHAFGRYLITDNYDFEDVGTLRRALLPEHPETKVSDALSAAATAWRRAGGYAHPTTAAENADLTVEGMLHLSTPPAPGVPSTRMSRAAPAPSYGRYLTDMAVTRIDTDRWVGRLGAFPFHVRKALRAARNAWVLANAKAPDTAPLAADQAFEQAMIMARRERHRRAHKRQDTWRDPIFGHYLYGATFDEQDVRDMHAEFDLDCSVDQARQAMQTALDAWTAAGGEDDPRASSLAADQAFEAVVNGRTPTVDEPPVAAADLSLGLDAHTDALLKMLDGRQDPAPEKTAPSDVGLEALSNADLQVLDRLPTVALNAYLQRRLFWEVGWTRDPVVPYPDALMNAWAQEVRNSGLPEPVIAMALMSSMAAWHGALDASDTRDPLARALSARKKVVDEFMADHPPVKALDKAWMDESRAEGIPAVVIKQAANAEIDQVFHKSVVLAPAHERLSRGLKARQRVLDEWKHTQKEWTDARPPAPGSPEASINTKGTMKS